MASTPDIRPMTRDDLEFAHGLSKLMGWNQTEDDWRRLLYYECNGCFVAELRGKPVGTVTTTPYGRDLAWIGMLLVHPAMQGQGIGKALLFAAPEIG